MYMKCLVCASSDIQPIFEIPPIPVDTNRIWPSQKDASAAPKVAMSLVYCGDCGHVFNRNYDDDLVDYEIDYENSQMFSPRFRQYCEELSDQLITKHDLRRKNIVEIGGWCR